MTIDRNPEEILPIAAQHGARNVRVFGSVARGDDRADSDVDLLVEMADNLVKAEHIYLGHIRDAISDIRAYASVGGDSFLADRMRQDAIIRKLEIIGEAVNRLSPRQPERNGPRFPGRRSPA